MVKATDQVTTTHIGIQAAADNSIEPSAKKIGTKVFIGTTGELNTDKVEGVSESEREIQGILAKKRPAREQPNPSNVAVAGFDCISPKQKGTAYASDRSPRGNK